jgi:hypothetical protein
MKKMVLLLIGGIAIFTLTGCATSYPVGIIYTNVKLPVTATQNSGMPTKLGVSTSDSYLGIVATGDSSIDKAVRNVGITEVQYVDWQAKSILGFHGIYKTLVKGK